MHSSKTKQDGMPTLQQPKEDKRHKQLPEIQVIYKQIRVKLYPFSISGNKNTSHHKILQKP